MSQDELTIAKAEKELAEFVVHKCEVYSRVVGYFRPIKQWNPAKLEEWNERKKYIIDHEDSVSEDPTQ